MARPATFSDVVRAEALGQRRSLLLIMREVRLQRRLRERAGLEALEGLRGGARAGDGGDDGDLEPQRQAAQVLAVPHVRLVAYARRHMQLDTRR